MDMQDQASSSQMQEECQKIKRCGNRFFSSFFFGVLGGVAGFAVCALSLYATSHYPIVRSVVERWWSSGSSVASDTKCEPYVQNAGGEDSTIAVVQKSIPSVVSVIAKKNVPTFRMSPFDYFFNPYALPESPEETEKQQVGGGTGFFVSSDGMIVTNKHVVSDTRAEYSVILQDGKEYSARILARDPSRDIAVIKIEGSDFPVLELGDSDVLEVGQTVVAIGNSLGEFTNSVSRGVVSGLRRNITAGSGFGGSLEHLEDIIQTDAAINPGNSGGPLLDMSGRIVGINTAIAQGAQNVGFALPINPVKEVIAQVKETGEISAPFLGIRYVLLSEDIQKQNNLKYNYGALVLRGETRMDFAVIPGSPADKAGIAENDIILEIDGKKITEENDLARTVSKYRVGDTLRIKVWHKGEEKEVKVQLEKRN